MQKIFFYNKFIIRFYMFRALCVHHQEVKIVLYSIWYHQTCRWPSPSKHVKAYKKLKGTATSKHVKAYKKLIIK